MPASTLDPVNAALRASLSKNSSENILESQIVGSTKKALLANIEFESAGSYHSSLLDSLKSKYVVLKSAESTTTSSIKTELDMCAEETLKLPKYELYPMESVQLGWSEYSDWSAGNGMINMGNTCYLNSTLQALFHVPALVNWLMSDREHSSGCFEAGGLCIICSMRKTLIESQNSNLNAIRPLHIYNKLRFICRNFILGRQEDAHEFLRHLVEAMEKAYLSRFRNHDQLDSKVKETTPLNQIFGGYLRSAVHCLVCDHVSTTFQHFQDLLLDIRKPQTLEEALDGYFSREKLDDESYQCESCKRKVAATKQFSIEKAPIALCIQLKRFSISNTKITKHISFRQRLDLTKFARNRPSTPLVYKLVSLVTHMGPTVNCGHYTAVGLAPSGSYYQFDDSTVRPISYQGVFTTNAYILMYELESSSQRNSVNNSQKLQIIKSTSVEQHCNKPKTLFNGVGTTSSKAYGPELPPNKACTNGDISTLVSNTNGKEAANDDCESTKQSKNIQSEKDTSQNQAVKKKINLSPTKSESNDQFVPHKAESRVIPFSPPFENSITFQKRNYSSDNVKKTSITQLVPYEADDSSNSEDSNHVTNKSNENVASDTVNGVWNVTSTSDTTYEPSSVAKSWSKNKSQNDRTINELFKMSHSGYSAPVSSWNGTRAKLDKEISDERREARKRTLAELSDPIDQGRTKHVKSHNSFKSNPGYNPIEEYHSKNWNRSNGPKYYNNKQFYNSSNRHRHNFHHKNYHKNSRYRQ